MSGLALRPRRARIQNGGGGGERGSRGPLLKYHKKIVSLAIGPDPWKITKLLSQIFMHGQYRHSSETSFELHFAGGPMMARL